MILRDLFTNKNPGILPELVWSCNAIYKLTNLINGKCYVGQTVQVYSRFMCGNLSHLGAFEYQCRNNLTNYRLYNALRKYGCRNFELSILESDLLNKDEMNEREIFYISKFKSNDDNFGYNMTPGGNNGEQLNTEEVIIKRSLSVSITNLFTSIYYHLDYLHNEGLSINRINYSYYGLNNAHDKTRHIPKVLGRINDLRQDPRWTTEMESLFSEFEELGIPEHNLQRITNMIIVINRNIDNLKSRGLKLNGYNYAWNLPRNHHLEHVLKRLKDLRECPYWTNEMETIFGDIELNGIFNLDNK